MWMQTPKFRRVSRLMEMMMQVARRWKKSYRLRLKCWQPNSMKLSKKVWIPKF